MGITKNGLEKALAISLFGRITNAASILDFPMLTLSFTLIQIYCLLYW
jgi:hypothetical protein